MQGGQSDGAGRRRGNVVRDKIRPKLCEGVTGVAYG